MQSLSQNHIFLFLLWFLCHVCQKAISSNIYITPFQSCHNDCQGSLESPYDSLLLALEAATSVESPVIILLANDTTDHYVLPAERHSSDQSLLYDFSEPITFNFTSLEIKPLFCDEADNLTLPEDTSCINRDHKVTIYLKKLTISITVQNQLIVQNIVFNGIEAISDYNIGNAQGMSECVPQRERCCPSPDFVPSEGEFFCNPTGSENTGPILESFFKIDGPPEPSTHETYQEVKFVNTDLQYFWGKGVRSFIQVARSSYFSLTFENCTLDDIFFEQGLIYISETENLYSNQTFWNYSEITIKNMNFSNYNRWNRYETSWETYHRNPEISFYEGYLLLSEAAFVGNINILESTFQNMDSVSRRKCEWIEPYDYSPLELPYLFTFALRGPYTNLRDLCRDDSNSNFMSSFFYLPKFGGSLNVTGSNFTKIRGVEGSVFRIVDSILDINTTLVFTDSVFDQNFAISKFANILVTCNNENSDLIFRLRCPIVRIQNSKFTTTGGCQGSYGNVGFVYLFSSFDDWNNLASELVQYNDYDIPVLLPDAQPQISVKDSLFQSNLLALSNSLAIVGCPFIALERNRFLDNGGTLGEALTMYALSRAEFSLVQGMSAFENSYFGQSTAVYLRQLNFLKSSGNTFQGNWGPWHGSQALGISLTILEWDSRDAFFIQLENDSFIDHIGAHSIIDSYTQGYINCYSPPIITVADIFSYVLRSRFDHEPRIRLKGVKFSNNIANYARIERDKFPSRCYFYYFFGYTPSLFFLIDSNQRYRSGFLRFLTPSEVADDYASPTNTLYSWFGYGHIGLSFQDGEITNNTVASEGCLFPTLRLSNYMLDNLKIENNQVNAVKESYTSTNASNQANANANANDIINSRAGIFCSFQKNSIVYAQNLVFAANNLKVKDNIGPIFSLYPNELNSLSLTNSLFINNTCKFTSIISSLQGSNISMSNNIFIGNTNAFGTVFTTSSSNFYFSSFTTYLYNTGRQAALAYVDNQANMVQFFSRVYENNVSPPAYLFPNKTIPQAGLYFLSSSQLTILNSTFVRNNAYAGFIISTGSTVVADRIEINDHNIYGSNLLGIFLYESCLTITNANFTNNSIYANPLPGFQVSLITMIAGQLKIDNVNISDTPVNNAGIILFGNKVEGTVSNIIISDFRALSSNALISLSFSTIHLKNLQADNITSLFSFYQTIIDINSISIHRLMSNSISFYLMNTIASNLTISNLYYTGSVDTGEYLSLIIGLNNRIIINEAHFLNAVYGNSNKIFDLKESSFFLISKSAFEFTKYSPQPIIFVFGSSETVMIENCIFSQTGQIIQDENTKNQFYFVGNTILADPYALKLSTTETNIIYLLNNHFLASNSDSAAENMPFPISQIQIIDSSDLFKLNNNIFFSLYGSNGIVQIQGQKAPYNVVSANNTFLDNTGSLGGAFHFDASSKGSASNVTIDSSVFLLNKAKKIEDDSGKGGALYQTTSTFAIQKTSIIKSIFVSNSADISAGAIFFDYMLPQVDNLSYFMNNSANSRPNHIGSYPIKLGYYETEPDSWPVAIPGETTLSPQTPSVLHRWEDVPSGLSSGRKYVFALLDMFDQIVDSDNTSTLEVFPAGLTQKERNLFSNNLLVTAENGLYLYDSFRFTYKTYETINVTFKSSAIHSNITIPIDPPLTTINSFVIEAHFRGCRRGEYVFRDGNTTSCIQCQPGFWQVSPQPDIISCQACESISTFCLGADQVGPKKGYWRINETADIIRECRVAESCLGSEENGDTQGKCAIGYMGNLCSNCISGWAKTENGTCINCNTNFWYYIKVILVLIFQFGLIIEAVSSTLGLSKTFNDTGDQKLGLNQAILIRIITNYFQLISLIAGLPITWPDVITNFNSTSTQISSVAANVFTLDCLFGSDDINGVKIVFVKLIITTIGPFVLAMLGIMCTVVYFAIKKRSIFGNKTFNNQVVALIVVICFMMQPSAIQTAFSIFKCDNLYREDSPAYYLTKDYDVKCWEGSHLYWALGFGIPILVIWCVLLPLIAFYALRRNRKRLENTEVTQKYSFLYGGYTPNKYYWEMVVMFRKLLLISVILGASFYSSNLQIYVSVILIQFWYFLHMSTRPYSELRLNRLEQFSLIGVGVLAICGLYFKFVPSTLALDIIVIVCLIVGNLIFFVYFILLFLAIQTEKLRQDKKIIQILNKLGKKCKWINPTKVETLLTKMSTVLNDLTRKETKDNKRPTPLTPQRYVSQDTTREHSPETPREQIRCPSTIILSPVTTTRQLLTTRHEDNSMEKPTNRGEVSFRPRALEIFCQKSNIIKKEEGEKIERKCENKGEEVKKEEDDNSSEISRSVSIPDSLGKQEQDGSVALENIEDRE